MGEGVVTVVSKADDGTDKLRKWDSKIQKFCVILVWSLIQLHGGS